MPYPGPGYIREEKDVMYLILYALHFFPVAITESDLMDVVLIDDAFGYFEFRSAFQRLLDSRHVAMVMDHGEPMYFLTPEGARPSTPWPPISPGASGTRPKPPPSRSSPSCGGRPPSRPPTGTTPTGPIPSSCASATRPPTTSR